jgi:hypothetical protein
MYNKGDINTLSTMLSMYQLPKYIYVKQSLYNLFNTNFHIQDEIRSNSSLY